MGYIRLPVSDEFIVFTGISTEMCGLTQGSAEAVAAVLRIEDDPRLQHDLEVVIQQCAMLTIQQRIQQLAGREAQPVGEHQARLCRL